MAFLDMFDKIDDIIYKPVEAICDWTKEPLRKWEHERNMEAQAENIAAAGCEKAADREHEVIMAKQTADIQMALAEQEAENAVAEKRLNQELIEQERASVTADIEARAMMDINIRKVNAEIDELINDATFARFNKALQSIKEYKIEMAKVTSEIYVNIQNIAFDLRKKAQDLVYTHTERYIAMQTEARKQQKEELKQIAINFADNERVRIRLEDQVIDSTADIINAAKKFITELNEDIKRLNENADKFINEATTNSMKFVEDNSIWMLQNKLSVSDINAISAEKLKKLND